MHTSSLAFACLVFTSHGSASEHKQSEANALRRSKPVAERKGPMQQEIRLNTFGSLAILLWTARAASAFRFVSSPARLPASRQHRCRHVDTGGTAVSCSLVDMGGNAISRKRALVAAFVATGILTTATASQAALYCVPGVTEARCRGYFWETGEFYKREKSKSLTPSEYDIARKRLKELGVEISALQALVAETEPGLVGERAAKTRIELRKVGENVCDSLEPDESYESRQRLYNVLSILDELDVATLQAAKPDNPEASLPPDFTQVSLLLKVATTSLSKFLDQLPSRPMAP